MAKKKQYTNVVDLVQDATGDTSLSKDVKERIERRALVKHLLALRATRGLSQGDIAKKMNCTQSRVSKFERSADRDIRLGDVEDYLSAVGLNLRLVLTDLRMTAVGQVKYHAGAIKQLTDHLAGLAQHGDESMAKAIASFLGEAFFNLIKNLQDSARRLPCQSDGAPLIQIELQQMEMPLLAEKSALEVEDSIEAGAVVS